MIAQDELAREFRAVLDTQAADDDAAAVDRDREEVEDALESLRAALADVVGRPDAVMIRPWRTTNEGAGRNFVFCRGDGYEIRVFTISVPFDAYPVTIRVGDDVIIVRKGELDGALQNLIHHPSVIAAARAVMA